MLHSLMSRRRPGFSLVLVVIIFTTLAVLAVAAGLMNRNLAVTANQRQTIIRMNTIQDAVKKYFRGRELMPQGIGTGGKDVPVRNDYLNLEQKYKFDAWGQPFLFLVPPSGPGAISSVNIDVGGDGNNDFSGVAGAVISFGMDQTQDPSTNYANLAAIIVAGDDLVVPLNVQKEAREIASEELAVLTKKSCAFHIAANQWFDNWNDFLLRFALGVTYQTDPWGTSYDWNTDHWRSAGPDLTLGTNDDVNAPILNTVLCEYQPPTFHDPFNNMDNWNEVPPIQIGPFTINNPGGEHGIENHEGDNALAVNSVWSPLGFLWGRSLILFDWADADIDPETLWEDAGHFLSYDAQVKIDADTFSPGFMAGISFRNLTNDEYPGYGLSFVRPAAALLAGGDGIPDDLVPAGQAYDLMVVLWERLASGDQNWIAYKVLPKYFDFTDDMESGNQGWTGQLGAATHRWSLESYGAGNTAWRVIARSATENRNLISPIFDLSAVKTAKLSFRHERTGSWLWLGSLLQWARGRLQISTNGGSSWSTLTDFNAAGGATTEEYDLSDYTGFSEVQIRFRFQYTSSGDGATWYIDDFSVTADMPVDMSTLGFRLQEAAGVAFNNTQAGTQAPRAGEIVLQQDGSGVEFVRGRLLHDPIMIGTWGVNAQGTLLLNDIVGTTFNPSFALRNEAGAVIADVTGYRAKDNYIKAFYGLTTGQAAGNTNPFDQIRLPNPRPAPQGQLNWLPEEGEDYTADDDYFTIVQWQAVDPAALLMGQGNELNAIIRTDTHVSPDSGSFTDNELGLHTWGYNAEIFFDDFGIKY